MNASAIARPYAKAVFELAQNESTFSQWSATLALLVAIVTNEQAHNFLMRPNVNKGLHITLFTDVCGNHLDEKNLNFLQLLAEEDRLLFLPEIKKQYENLLAEHQKVIEVKVVTAFTINAEQQQQLATKLAERLQKNVALTYEIDSALIGGAVITANDKVIDGSIRGKLERLKEGI